MAARATLRTIEAVSAGRLMEWRRHTTRACNVRLLPGGPAFLSVRRRNTMRTAHRAKSPRRRCGLFSINWNSSCRQAKPR